MAPVGHPFPLKTYAAISSAFALCAAWGLLAPATARAAEGAGGNTAVASRTSSDYIREGRVDVGQPTLIELLNDLKK